MDKENNGFISLISKGGGRRKVGSRSQSFDKLNWRKKCENSDWRGKLPGPQPHENFETCGKITAASQVSGLLPVCWDNGAKSATGR